MTFRSEPYLRWVRALPCALTGYHPVDVAHIRDKTGIAQRPPDNHVLPLRHELHMAEHASPGGFWPAVVDMYRPEVIEFAEALNDLYPDEIAAIRHLEVMQRKANRPLIARMLLGVSHA